MADKPEGDKAKKVTKKEQVLALFSAGITDVQDLAAIIQVRPSYAAAVLQENDLLQGYFDLYTSTANPMNVYSKYFAGKLGYKDLDAAKKSLQVIDTYYRQFAFAEDRAGQHHALVMALTMYDRARWTGKGPEAEVFRAWLLERLNESAA